MLLHNDYIVLRLTEQVQESPRYWFQCVAQAKDYALQVHGIRLWSFWWSARKATYRKGWTFDPALWNKLTPWPTVRAERWDIVVINSFTGNPDWHVWVIHKQIDWGYYIIEQNAKTGNWKWYWDDAIMVNFKIWTDYPILNFYRKRW